MESKVSGESCSGFDSSTFRYSTHTHKTTRAGGDPARALLLSTQPPSQREVRWLSGYAVFEGVATRTQAKELESCFYLRFFVCMAEPLVTLVCRWCKEPFQTAPKRVRDALKRGRPKPDLCSTKCRVSVRRGLVVVQCAHCHKDFGKTPSQIRRTKEHFCSCSCAAVFNNTHKTVGTRRSKLEVWLEGRLTALHPSLEFHFNRKDAIGSELDIYVPALKLAFELNGIYHYEPIHGPSKLAAVQGNDGRKFLACFERGIDLCVIDTMSMLKFKPLKAEKFLAIIMDVLRDRTL